MREVSFGMFSKSRLLVLFILLLSLGALFYTSEPPTRKDTVFVHSDGFWMDAEYWALEEGKIDIRAGIEFREARNFSELYRMVKTGEADAAYIPLVLLPLLHNERPNLRLLPFREPAPEENLAIYVSENSSVTDSPCDLKNKVVSLPEATCAGIYGQNLLAKYALKKRCGLGKNAIKYVQGNESAAAKMYLGPPNQSLRENLEPVLFPLKYQPVHFVYVADKDIPQSKIEDMINAINSSGSYALSHVEKVAKLTNQPESNIPLFLDIKGESRYPIKPLEESQIQKMQSYVDYISGQYLHVEPVNLSKITRRAPK
ncbi:MAG: hypothetical protein ABEJ69_00355 [Candidatus Nanohaloarchaea archaeon]